MSAPVALIMAGGTGGMCSRRSQWRASCARAPGRSCGSARVAAWRRAWCRPRILPIEWLSVGGLRGKGLLTWLPRRSIWLRALFQALAVMRRHRPTVVVGLGGLVSGPGGVAAWLARRPLVIHEQNAIAGLTNRWLARLARVVLDGFPASFRQRRRARTDRQSGARRNRRAARRRRCALRTERRDPPARDRRQPGRARAQ